MAGFRKSLMFSFIDKYSVLAINFIMTAVVSRLLAPSEVGVFMVAAGLVMMTEAFRDFGVSVYLIQERDLTKQGVRTAFTVGLILLRRICRHSLCSPKLHGLVL